MSECGGQFSSALVRIVYSSQTSVLYLSVISFMFRTNVTTSGLCILSIITSVFYLNHVRYATGKAAAGGASVEEDEVKKDKPNCLVTSENYVCRSNLLVLTIPFLLRL